MSDIFPVSSLPQVPLVPPTGRSFIRGLWGVYDPDKRLGRWYSRRTKLDNDIRLAAINPYAPKCKVYIFGEDNFKILTDKGFDCVLIDKKPFVWDMEKEQYRHKIEIWRAGLQEFKEVVFLDWDCVPCAPIPNNFWDVISNGEKIRATIFMYKLKRVFFRNNDARKVSASTLVYINGLETCDGIIRTWEEIGRPWQEEVALSKHIDIINGGWKGSDDYMKKFETPYHTLYYWYPSEYINNVMLNNNIFYHLNCNKVSGILGDGKLDGVKSRLDAWQLRELSSIASLGKRMKEEESKKEQK